MARKGTQEIAHLFTSERLNSSTNGNPRFRLITDLGSYVTQSDASCAYDVENIVRRIPRGESLPVRLSLTPAGRVWNIEPMCQGETGTHDDRCGRVRDHAGPCDWCD